MYSAVPFINHATLSNPNPNPNPNRYPLCQAIRAAVAEKAARLHRAAGLAAGRACVHHQADPNPNPNPNVPSVRPAIPTAVPLYHHGLQNSAVNPRRCLQPP